MCFYFSILFYGKKKPINLFFLTKFFGFLFLKKSLLKKKLKKIGGGKKKVEKKSKKNENFL